MVGCLAEVLLVVIQKTEGKAISMVTGMFNEQLVAKAVMPDSTFVYNPEQEYIIRFRTIIVWAIAACKQECEQYKVAYGAGLFLYVPVISYILINQGHLQVFLY